MTANKIIKFFVKLGVLLSVFVLLLVVYANWQVLKYTKYITPETELESTRVALIFGGGMKPDGEMSDMQTDRVIQGIELYKTGKIQKLVMTGDDGKNHADEVAAMKKYAEDHGVPSENIVLDGHGYNTYRSCFRAKNVLGINEAIAISQNFHLPRILYFCNKLGVHTIGFSADLREYNLRDNVWVKGPREILARLKGWWFVEVKPPKPEYSLQPFNS